jgi:RNA polymerase sigma-70 factor, ECF subfamily
LRALKGTILHAMAEEAADEQLIRDIERRDVAALRALYRRHSRMVYSVAFGVLGDAAAADEVTQDVFLQVWEKAGTYREEKARVVTWISRIARNRAIDVLRKNRSRDARAQGAWAEQCDAVVSSAVRPGERLERDELAARVRDAVASLPPDQQDALARAFFQGRTHQEIAEELGEPLGTVKTRIRAAMQKLRAMLGGAGDA